MSLLFRQKYFDGNISRGFISLYTGKTIVLIASGLLSVFVPIFLYITFGNNFQLVILFYGVSSLLYVVFLPYGGKFLSQFGFRKALRVSVFLGALYYALFFFMNEENIWTLIGWALLVLTLYRLFYWLPYHIDFAKFTDKKNRGRELSAIRATRLLATVFLPVVSGLVITAFGFDVLFLLAIVLFLVSGIPYITIPRTNEIFEWSYGETWKKFFQNARHKVLIAYMADGAETLIGLMVWPIFIFGLLKGNYFEVGAITTLIIGAAVLLQLAVGKRIDLKKQSEQILTWGSILYSLGWIVKIFIVTAFEIFVAGAYHNIVKIFTRTPFDTMTYEMSADEGHYVDEFTVLKEVALHSGRVLMAALVVLLSFFFAVQWVFLLAALAALLLNFISARDVHLAPLELR